MRQLLNCIATIKAIFEVFMNSSNVFSNTEPEFLPDFEPNESLPDIHHISITKPGILKLLNINPKKG